MKHIDIETAKITIEDLIKLTQGGHQFLITKDGKPIAKLLPISPMRTGLLTGVYDSVPEDIDTPFKDEIEAMFYGKDKQ